MLPWDLEDWLTDAGDAIVERRAAEPALLTEAQSIVYEIWLLDTEARNGGLSQYFCNRGVEQWERCLLAASALKSFEPFAAAVGIIIDGKSDPYEAIHSAGRRADDLWYSYQVAVVGELRAKFGDAL